MEWTAWIEDGSRTTSRDVVPMVPPVAREVLAFSADPEVSARKIDFHAPRMVDMARRLTAQG